MNELKTVSTFYRSVVGFTPHPSDELLLGYVEERVSPREKNRIEAHLEACSQCREDFLMLQHFAKAIPSAPTPTLVMTELEDTPELSDPPPPLRLSVAPLQEVASAPDPIFMPEKVTPPPPKTPRRAPAEPAARPRPTLLIASLFLGVNALGLGAIYGTISRSAPSRATATPAPSASEPKPAGSVAVIQAAYERRLAQDQGKIAALEKQIQALRKAPAPLAAPSAQAKSPAGERLLEPGALTLDKGGSRSLSVHPTITWKPAARAHHYAVELTDASGKSVVKTQLRREEWRVAAALLRGETYRWSAAPQDRDNQPLGEIRTGDVTIASEEDATKLSDQLKTLAAELERQGFPTDATALKESAETVLKK
ncbi:zf-HC2 domain-containing protein [Armatimonas sp.]|uniref:zf-HC2 domain-containing protein n=1 Tax=Armatimonas sp. TaxID=1872638 RepID=UPI00286A2B17|nr:zf-HC2 domain-containing protein [Armatimonas sp.]